MPRVRSDIRPQVVHQKTEHAHTHTHTHTHTYIYIETHTLHRTQSRIRSESASSEAVGKCNPNTHTDTHTHARRHTQAWLYFGMLLCGERCEGLEGLDGVDFAVNLQSLCTLTAASLIICGGPPITVENQGWEGQKIYHSSSSIPLLPSLHLLLYCTLQQWGGRDGGVYCLLFKAVVITHISFEFI